MEALIEEGESSAVVPVLVKERDYPNFRSFIRPEEASVMVMMSMENVLKIMMVNDFLLMPDRQAVWFKFEMHSDVRPSTEIHEKIGTAFPDDIFGYNCKFFSAEKVERTIAGNLFCSHQNRNPLDKKWGGSSRLVFEFLSLIGTRSITTCFTAPSGFKEWEDLALGLGAYYKLGLIRLEDQQVMDILQIADDSVVGQPEFLPKGRTITQYTKDLFYAIDGIN